MTIIKDQKSVWQISEAKASFSKVIDRAEYEPQFIRNRDQRVAVIISPADYELLRKRKERWRLFTEYSQELAFTGDFSLYVPKREKTEPKF